MKLNFGNRVALVTGAGRGIGRSIAHLLAKSGMTVICVSRNPDSCESTAAQIREAGGQAESMAVDVADAAAVKAACETILETHACVDVLINNAGITKDGLFVRMGLEDWNAVIDTNLSSCFHWSNGLVRPMTRKRWGRIVNISSVVGIMGNAGQVNYAAAKAGMIGMTKSLAKELASRSITVNVVAPGFTQTDMTQDLREDIVAAAMKQIPLGRFGQSEDVAHMVGFLCSEEAGYITGQVFTVDGGMCM